MAFQRLIDRARAKHKKKAKAKIVAEESDESSDQVPEEDERIAADEHFYVGAVLNSRYMIMRFIDRGAYARVWHAYDTHEHRGVALKTWIISGAKGEKSKREALDESKDELQLLRKLRGCEGCVQSSDDFKVGTKGARCAVIPFAGAICDVQLDAANAEKAWRSCAQALSRAHERGVAHSDLKQRNILFHTDYSINDDAGKWVWETLHRPNPTFTPDELSAAFMVRRAELPGPPNDDPVHLDKCLLIDFRGTNGGVAPSWQFCAPEVLLEQAKGPEQDWWAMACVGLYWANGYHPFKPTREESSGSELKIEREILARITERMGQHAPRAIWENYADHFNERGRVKKIKVTKRPDEPLIENATPQLDNWLRGILRWQVKDRVYPDFTNFANSTADTSGTVIDGMTTVILEAQKVFDMTD
jgi:serine/threonine protein kinase